MKIIHLHSTNYFFDLAGNLTIPLDDSVLKISCTEILVLNKIILTKILEDTKVPPKVVDTIESKVAQNNKIERRVSQLLMPLIKSYCGDKTDETTSVVLSHNDLKEVIGQDIPLKLICSSILSDISNEFGVNIVQDGLKISSGDCENAKRDRSQIVSGIETEEIPK